MKGFAKCLLAGLSLAAALPLAHPALAQIVSETVTFARGASATTVGGTLRGNQIRDYAISVRAGQTLTINKTGSPIIYFNVMPPRSQGEAVFIGSSSGTRYSGRVSETGIWRIRVYQMRASARRGERGSYRMQIAVAGRGFDGGYGHRPDNALPPGNRPGGGPRPGAMGSIAGIAGMNAIAAIDALRERGFQNVDSFSSGNTLYGIYYYRPTRLCVQTTSADSRILDIRDIRTHPKCR